MDKKKACALVRNYLSKKIELTFHEKPPDGISLWNFNPTKEILFSYRLGGQHQQLGVLIILPSHEFPAM